MLAWNASVQRANIYKKQTEAGKSTHEKQKKEFRRFIKRHVRRKILPQYSNAQVLPNLHIQNLQNLVRIGTDFGSQVLKKEYKLGVAQKFLNLTLKYHWCMGWIPEPPHCPVDRIILSETHLEGKLNWTDITDLNVYEQAIDAINIKALEKNLSLAEYELQVFSRR